MRTLRLSVFLLTLVLCIAPALRTYAQCSDSDNIEYGPDDDWFGDWDDFGDDWWGNDGDDWWGGDDEDDWWDDDWWGDDDEGDDDGDDWWEDWWGEGDDEDGDNWWDEDWWEDDEEELSLEEQAKRAEEEAERAKEELADRNEDLSEAEKALLRKKGFLDDWIRLLADPDFDDRPQEERRAITDNIKRLQGELDGKEADLDMAEHKQAMAADAERRAAEANANLQKLLAEKKEAERQAAIEAARLAEERARREAEAAKKAALEREAQRQREEAERLRREAEEARRREQREREKAEMAKKLEEEYNQGAGTTTDEDEPDEEISDVDIGMEQPTTWFGWKDRDATAEEVHQKVMENLTRISGSGASDSQNLAISQADKFQKGEYAKSNLKDIAAGVVTSTLNCGLSKMSGPVGTKLKNAIEGVMDTYDQVSGYYENAQEVYDSIAHSLRDQGMEVHQDTFQGLNYTLTTTTVFDPATREYTTHVARTPTGTQGTMSRALLDCSMEEFNNAMAGQTSSAVVSGKINYE